MRLRVCNLRNSCQTVLDDEFFLPRSRHMVYVSFDDKDGQEYQTYDDGQFYNANCVHYYKQNIII